MSSLMINAKPGLERKIKSWVNSHRKLKDEPLRLALAFAPGGRTKDIFILEAAENFGGNRLSEERELMEVGYAPSPDMPLAPGSWLRLVLTSPAELRAALAEGWPSARRVAKAVRRGDCKVLFKDKVGAALLEELKSE